MTSKKREYNDTQFILEHDVKSAGFFDVMPMAHHTSNRYRKQIQGLKEGQGYSFDLFPSQPISLSVTMKSALWREHYRVSLLSWKKNVKVQIR